MPLETEIVFGHREIISEKEWVMGAKFTIRNSGKLLEIMTVDFMFKMFVKGRK